MHVVSAVEQPGHSRSLFRVPGVTAPRTPAKAARKKSGGRGTVKKRSGGGKRTIIKVSQLGKMGALARVTQYAHCISVPLRRLRLRELGPE